MRIISLNIEGGKLKNELIKFFKTHSGNVDIFCLQEVFNNGKTTRDHYRNAEMGIFNVIQSALPMHKGYFKESQTNEEGLAMFVSNNISVINHDDIFPFRFKDAMENNDSRTLGRNLQYVTFMSDGQSYLIANFHGLWNDVNRLDSEDRVIQSRKIIDFISTRPEYRKVLIGDFNLMPDTESIKIIEKNMKNLMREKGIISTRSSLCKEKERMADYCFVSPEIVVKSFSVMNETISDHLPFMLEI